jgi:hypothetical protein
MRALTPNQIVTSEEVGRAMLAVARHGYAKSVLEPADIGAICRAPAGPAGTPPLTPRAG